MNNKVPLLVGSSNYIEWHRTFARVSKDKDSLGLAQDSNADNEADAAETPAQNPSNTSVFIPDNTAFARFQHDHRQYEKGQKKIKTARKLITSSVSPIIATRIQNKDDPVEAYEFLKKTYKVSNTNARQKLLAQLRDTTLNKYKFNVENYVSKVLEIREDLLEYDEELSDEEVSEYLLSGLPDCYAGFKEHYGWLMRFRGDPDGHDLQALTEELIKESARRDETAKAKKFKAAIS
ncbi:hypothetical protein A1O3_10262 [Capronia epimyces CBS 606.96]|uniref:Uncharacterized protein n=1 Tax=Capronia epimyces CBS 606.96 TaxID=1182542 RepID=W9Y3Q9_9EURO|nr:uncharacterized protein A1O3_10262 [Capronia epimyces CBS 606.96]EXJ77104.1 hypothetical protein A1O3_10262 [Capronia epimyces CBS 606.96]